LHNKIDLNKMAEVGQPEIPSKKRKRTGKQREEAKRLAIVSPRREVQGVELMLFDR
jgi:hypothetical protein